MRHEKYDIVVMDSEKMESVKLMFSLCLDGMSLGQIKNVNIRFAISNSSLAITLYLSSP